MKKLLYIHHSFHNRTKSNHFLRELLQSRYEVDFFAFDPLSIDFPFDELKGKKYDVVVLFQIMPSIQKLKDVLEFEHGIFFPMFDGVPRRDCLFWYEYKEFRIINFSKTLHEELLALGFDSHYFQYFPKPAESFNWGDEKSVFFWQRINKININLLDKVLYTDALSHIHIHKAVDPLEVFTEPSKKLTEKCSFSDWFETKEELNTVIESSALYFAPRLLEGIGMSFLEAMAMGRCVIAPDNPTMNEYIVHNETGFLYDFDRSRKIKLENIRQIQKNAYEYIKKGYQEWEKNKFAVLDLLELPVHEHVKKKNFYAPLYVLGFEVPFLSVGNFGYKKKYYLFNKVPLFKVLYDSTNEHYYLFDFMLLFTIANFGYKKKYYLFNKIPLFKKLYTEHTIKFYLFGFILLFTVEKEK